jgi:hypothetical protein
VVYFGKKEPIYTDHARERMAYRKVTEEEVEFVLNNPDTTLPGEPGTLKITGHPKNRRVEIMVPLRNPCQINSVVAD